MTDNILQLINQQRLAKNDAEKYKNLQWIFKGKINTAKENLMKGQYREIETYNVNMTH